MKREQIKKVFTDLDDLKEEGIWSSGIEDEGEYRRWHDNSQLYQHFFYKDGKIDGEFKQWYHSGILYQHCFYKNDKRDGEFKLWRLSGKLYRHELYKKGKIIKDYMR